MSNLIPQVRYKPNLNILDWETGNPTLASYGPSITVNQQSYSKFGCD